MLHKKESNPFCKKALLLNTNESKSIQITLYDAYFIDKLNIS